MKNQFEDKIKDYILKEIEYVDSPVTNIRLLFSNQSEIVDILFNLLSFDIKIITYQKSLYFFSFITGTTFALSLCENITFIPCLDRIWQDIDFLDTHIRKKIVLL